MMHEHTKGKHEERKSKPHIGLVCVRAEKIINHIKNVSRSHTDSLLLCQLYHLIGEIREDEKKSLPCKLREIVVAFLLFIQFQL